MIVWGYCLVVSGLLLIVGVGSRLQGFLVVWLAVAGFANCVVRIFIMAAAGGAAFQWPVGVMILWF